MSWTAAIAAGAIMGFLISVLGGGGSLFIVPVLLIGFDEPLARATGTSLIVVFAGALVGAITHWRAGRVHKRTLLFFGPAALVGASLGALLHPLVPERFTTIFLCAVLLFASARMVFGKLPEPTGEEIVDWRRTVPLGFGLGGLTGFAGVGGGFLIVPVLIWGARLSLPKAIGTSVAAIALSCATGAVTHVLNGNVDLDLAGAIGGGAVAGALLGAPVSGRLPERPLRLGFGVLVFLVALYLLFRTSR